MKLQAYLLSLSLLALFYSSCTQSKSNAQQTVNAIPSNSVNLDANLLDQVRVPFLKNNKYYLSNWQGEIISDIGYDEMILKRNAPLLITKKGNLYGAIDYSGKTLVENTFERSPWPMITNRKGRKIPDLLVVANDTIILNLDKYEELEKLSPYPIVYGEQEQANYAKGNELINKLKSNGFQDKKIKISSDKINVNRVLPSNRWILVTGNGLSGIISNLGKWQIPLGNYKITSYGRMHNSLCSFKVEEGDCMYLLNRNLEIIHQYSKNKIQKDYLKVDKIPVEFSFDIESSKMSRSLNSYIILSSNGFAHIFKHNGDYISSHEGEYLENLSTQGQWRTIEFTENFIPIGYMRSGNQTYYIRLTDGFEYR